MVYVFVICRLPCSYMSACKMWIVVGRRGVGGKFGVYTRISWPIRGFFVVFPASPGFRRNVWRGLPRTLPSLIWVIIQNVGSIMRHGSKRKRFVYLVPFIRVTLRSLANLYVLRLRYFNILEVRKGSRSLLLKHGIVGLCALSSWNYDVIW